MSTKVQEMIFSILREDFAKDSETTVFKKLKHNKDLVPKINDNLNYLVEFYGRYSNASYDIQGIRDNGIDILIKYCLEDDFKLHYIGLQIKSFDDIEEESWLTKLKAQLFDSDSYKDVEDIYVVFCTDCTRHKNKIRNATADILKANDKIHIIEPTRALTFYKMNKIDIAIRVQHLFQVDDPLFKDAANSLSEFNFIEAAVIIEATVKSLVETNCSVNENSLFESHFVQNILERYGKLKGDFFCDGIMVV